MFCGHVVCPCPSGIRIHESSLEKFGAGTSPSSRRLVVREFE